MSLASQDERAVSNFDFGYATAGACMGESSINNTLSQTSFLDLRREILAVFPLSSTEVVGAQSTRIGVGVSGSDRESRWL
jgi:hypothetical protein